MKRKEAFTFLLKLTLFTAPLWVLIIVYCVVDPFKVIWSYKSYFPARGVSVITGNDDYMATQNFLNKYKKNDYNAYIFGNSRSFQYRIADWQKYIGNQHCLHFGTSRESLYGIEKKLLLIDSLGCKIDDALIIIDYTSLRFIQNSKGYLFEKHPALSGQSWFSFQLDFIETFFNPEFMPVFLDYLATGKYKPYMKHVMNYIPIEYSPEDNELKFYYYDSLLEHSPDAYYVERQATFYKRPDTVKITEVIIGERQKELLNGIKNVLVKHHTNYVIVINPLYDQIKLDTPDVDYLKQIFGSSRVFDFSGINSITANYHNYYEDSHYRPAIASQILDSIYATGPLDKSKSP